MRDAFRMANRIGDRYRASLRNAKQGETLETCRIDNGFEIADESFERNLLDLPIREAVSASVVADQRVVARQLAIKMPPDRALEVKFEMRHPIAGLDERRPIAHSRIGELNPVRRAAELDFLLVALSRLSIVCIDPRSGLRYFRHWERLNLSRGEPEDADRTRDVLNGLL